MPQLVLTEKPVSGLQLTRAKFNEIMLRHFSLDQDELDKLWQERSPHLTAKILEIIVDKFKGVLFTDPIKQSLMYAVENGGDDIFQGPHGACIAECWGKKILNKLKLPQ